jgi:hypothetical protein
MPVTCRKNIGYKTTGMELKSMCLVIAVNMTGGDLRKANFLPDP